MSQRVRYVNPKGKAAVFGMDPPYVFESIAGTGIGDVQQSVSEPADLDGVSFEDLLMGPRDVTLKFNIRGNTRTELYENRQALYALLNPIWHKGGVLGRLEYTNEYGSAWIPACVKKGLSEFTRVGNNFKSVQCVFYCPSPYWRGMETQYSRIKLAYLGGGMSFPLRFGAVKFGARGYLESIYNYGDSPSHLEVDITGPATRPQITKARTGEYIRLREDKELYEGDTLHIDTTPGSPSVTIKRSTGVTEQAIGYLDLTSTLFLCDPGETKLQYESGDDGQSSVVTVATLPWWGGR